MTLTTETLLPTTVYGTPSGNYDGSSTAFIGNAIPAANFYGGQGSAQTWNNPPPLAPAPQVQLGPVQQSGAAWGDGQSAGGNGVK